VLVAWGGFVGVLVAWTLCVGVGVNVFVAVVPAACVTEGLGVFVAETFGASVGVGAVVGLPDPVICAITGDGLTKGASTEDGFDFSDCKKID